MAKRTLFRFYDDCYRNFVAALDREGISYTVYDHQQDVLIEPADLPAAFELLEATEIDPFGDVTILVVD